MGMRGQQIRPFYLSDRLRQQLWKASEYGTTFLMAPTGYGKTTAVRQFAEQMPNARFHWFSAKWDDPASDFAVLCKVIARFAPDTAKELALTIQDGQLQVQRAAQLLREIHTPGEQEIYLVIDDMNHMLQDVPAQLLDALIAHGDAHMHLMLLGMPTPMQRLHFDRYAVLWVGAQEFLLQKSDIQALFQLEGGALTLEEADAIHEQTQGWPAAVSYYLANTLSGSTHTPRDVTHWLFAQVCFDTLEPEAQYMLMGLSQFEVVTQADVAAFVEGEEQQRRMFSLLGTVPLLRVNRGSLSYQIPAVLRELLQVRLDHSSFVIRRSVYVPCGRRFEQMGNLVEAIHCFYRVADYAAILSLNLRLLSYSRIGDVPFEKVAREIVEDCPATILQKYPIGLLRLAYMLYAAGDMAGYQLALKRGADFMRPQQEPELYGEWLMITMLQYLPDLPAMHKVLREAELYLRGPSRAISREEPFMFGTPSMWYAFYRTAGQGDLIADQLEAWALDYQRITGGRGAGAGMLYRAELASMRCQYEQSNAYLHMAMSQAEDGLQSTVVYGCAMLMARNAISRRDDEGVRAALRYIDDSSGLFAELQDTALHSAMIATVRVMILSMMREVGMENELTSAKLQVIRDESVLMQMTLHVRVIELMMTGEIDRAFGEMQAAMQRGSRLYNLVMVYVVSMASSIYYMYTGRQQEALAAIRQSLSIAQDDKLYALYVNHWDLLSILLRSPELQDFQLLIDRVAELAEAQRGGKPAEPEEQPQLPSTLSTREREVAVLAGRGMTNPEIAGELYITESTVKKHMQTIFAKMDIDRRSKLVALLKRK